MAGPGWLAAVGADDQPELHLFATGIRQDKEAVLNGLSLPYSSGPVEGTVNKIKTVKRRCTAEPASRCSASAS